MLGTGSDDVIVYKGRYGDVDVAVKVFGCQLDNGDPAPELPTHMLVIRFSLTTYWYSIEAEVLSD